MADTTLPALLGTGTHAARPAAGDVGTGAIYYCSDHDLIYQTDGSSWTTWAPVGGSSDLDAIITASSGQDIADALAGAAAPDSGNVFATMADVGGGSLSYVQNKLGADVSIVSANTFYDGPACTLSAGTWLLTGQILGLTGGNGGVYELKLWDGTTVESNTKVSLTAVAQWVGPLPLQGIVVIAAGTPTWKISATSNTTGYSIKAAGDGNISGNVASILNAVKIA